MTEEKIQEITQLFIENPTLTAHEVENGYIFGAYGTNEHYKLEDIQTIKTLVSSRTEIPTESETPPSEENVNIEEVVNQILPPLEVPQEEII